MATDFTRRTHVVRISDAGKDEDPKSANHIDVEVLDAICFHIDGGKEVVLSLKSDKAYIDDQTDGDNGKRDSNASRRSHIKRVKGKNGAELDVETIECAAFTDQNGGEWVLNMKDPGNVVDTEGDGSSDGASGGDTRRGHSEKITDPYGQGKKANSYVTMQRHDMIAFRTPNGHEVILKAPSSDDPNKPESPRASTFITPEKYDPSDDEQKVPENKDGNVYFAFVKDKSDKDGKSKDFVTGDEKIVTGPLWWIRKIHAVGGIIYGTVGFSSDGPLPTVMLETNAYEGSYDLLGDIKKLADGKGSVYPPVVDPVSPAMLGSLLQWTPQPVYKNTVTTEIDVWIIDTALWSGVLNHFCTGQVASGPREATRLLLAQALYDAYGATTGMTPPNFPEYGVGYLTNTCQDAPGPPDPSFFAVPGNTAHVEPHEVKSVAGQAVFALNFGLLKNQLKKDATELTFTITISGSNTTSTLIGALGYKSLKKFPLDSKNVPKFKPTPSFAGGGVGSSKVVGHIKLKNNKDLDITYDGGGGPPRPR